MTGQGFYSAQRINQVFENAFGPVVRAAFRAKNLPVEWGMAIARIESGFDPHAYKGTGGDGKLGGAYGICQMTLETAQGLGFTGPATNLYDAALCSQYAALLCYDITKRHGRALLDVAACYNGGAPYARANARARNYAETVNRFANFYMGKFDGETAIPVT